MLLRAALILVAMVGATLAACPATGCDCEVETRGGFGITYDVNTGTFVEDGQCEYGTLTEQEAGVFGTGVELRLKPGTGAVGTCGNAVQFRARRVKVKHTINGTPCPADCQQYIGGLCNPESRPCPGRSTDTCSPTPAPTPPPPPPAERPPGPACVAGKFFEQYAWKLIVKTSGGRMTSDLSAAQRQEMTSASKVAFAWNHGGSVSNAHDPMSYQMVAEVTSTGGGRPGWASSTRGGGGFQCSSSYYQRVKVNCIKGSCGMPSRMYIGTHSGHVCYNRAVGLVDNASAGNGQCDWHVDGQRFTSLYLGRPGDNGGCSKVTTTGGSRYIPAASAIFAWTDQSN